MWSSGRGSAGRRPSPSFLNQRWPRPGSFRGLENWGVFLTYGVPSGDSSSCRGNTAVRMRGWGQGTGAVPKAREPRGCPAQGSGRRRGSHLHRDRAALLLRGSGEGSGQGHSCLSQGLGALLLAFPPGFAATLPLPTHAGHLALGRVGHIIGDLIKTLGLAVSKGTQTRILSVRGQGDRTAQVAAAGVIQTQGQIPAWSGLV